MPPVADARESNARFESSLWHQQTLLNLKVSIEGLVYALRMYLIHRCFSPPL